MVDHQPQQPQTDPHPQDAEDVDAEAEPQADAGREKRLDGQVKYSAPALEKGLNILELLSSEQRGLTQTEIAEKMGKSISEIFRMIMCLRDLGYVAFIPDTDRYFLTPKLFELSHRHPPMKRLIAEAMPRMQALARTLQQSCHMTVFNDGHQVVIAQVDSPGGMGFSVRIGTQMDLVLTASGRALMAFETEDRMVQMLEEYRGGADAQVVAQVRDLLPDIRAAGYADMPSHQVRGVHGLACPVCDRLQRPVAALVVPYLAQTSDVPVPALDEAIVHLGRAASELARAIGGEVGQSELIARPVSARR
jgi:DNA-binding IclR family transcriptional regulator